MIDQPAANDNGYDAAAIKVLAGLEPVRRRPSAMIGCDDMAWIEAIETAYARGEITADEMAARFNEPTRRLTSGNTQEQT